MYERAVSSDADTTLVDLAPRPHPRADLRADPRVVSLLHSLEDWLPCAIAYERAMNVAHWTSFEHGGHFAALERPDDLVGSIRAFARSLD